MKTLITLALALFCMLSSAQLTITQDPNTKLYGAKDASGKIVIPFDYTYLYASKEGQYLATKCESPSSNCIKGVLDYSNKIIVPFLFDDIVSTENFYRVHQGCIKSWYSYECTGGTIGYYDKYGKQVIPCVYDNTDLGYWDWDWYDNRKDDTQPSEGLFNLSLNGRWGYVDYSGKEIIPFQFESATTFYQDSAIVFMDDQEFYINKKGQCIKNCPYDFTLKSKEDLVDQTTNYNKVVREMVSFYDNEAKKFAGLELQKREAEMYTNIQQEALDVIFYGTPEQQKVVKYIYLQTTLNVASKRDTISYIYPYLNKVRFIAENLSESQFPITFQHEGKTRSYSVENCKTTLANYYELLSECEYRLKNGRAEKDLKKAIQLGNHNKTNKCLSIGFLIDFKQEFKHYDLEILDYSNLLLETYLDVDQAGRAKLDSLALWIGNQPAAVESAFTSNSSEKIPNEFYLKGYKNYQILGEKAYAFDFMQKAYINGASDASFLWDFVEALKQANNAILGEEVLNKLYIFTSGQNCKDLQRIAEYYMYFGNLATAREIKKQADTCFDKKIKEDRKSAKKQSRSRYVYGEADNGIYLGIDVLPLLRLDAAKRDFGFKVDLIGKNVAHEFYYKKQNNDRDFMYDLSNADNLETTTTDIYWNGYTAAYGLKFFNSSSSESVFFVGPMFRYRSKDYGSIDTLAYNVENPNNYFNAAFHPKEEQYEVLLNYGVQKVKPGFAAEFYFGFGPKYSVFHSNPVDPLFDNEKIYVTNPIIEGRKSTRWGMGARVGFTIGIKIF